MARCVISLHFFISTSHQTSCSSKKALLFSAKHAVHFKLYISGTKKKLKKTRNIFLPDYQWTLGRLNLK